LVAHVAGVEGAGWLEEEHLGFLIGDGSMLDTPRNDQELSCLEPNEPIAKLHAESTLHDEKQLILVLMMVPDKRSEEFHQFDMLAIEFASDFRAPLFGE